MDATSALTPLLALLVAPLLLGVINKTKAFFAGRAGPPILQPYRDLVKLARKDAVYSHTTTWVFRAGPIVTLAATGLAILFVPLGGVPAAISFDGDVVLVIYLLGLGRFFTVLAALDTGSSFEGMGASREVQLAALAEPGLLLGLLVIVLETGETSLSEMMTGLAADCGPWVALVFVALLLILLAETARIPVDDPATHLELTMIHEVMVLDHGGPDLAFVELAGALKLWLLGALVTGVALPVPGGSPALGLAFGVMGMLGLALLIGVIESSMARLPLVRVPQLLVGAAVLNGVAFFLVMR